MAETDWNGAFDVGDWMRCNSFSERYELAVGCYTFELCLLWPYRNGSAIEVVRLRCWRWWRSGALRGVLMGNRGEGRPTRDYLVEGLVIVYIRIFCLNILFTFSDCSSGIWR